jgi:ribosomal protein S27E
MNGMNCEHHGWKIVVLRVSTIRGEESQNFMLIRCGGCGDFRCLNFSPGEFS